jgi:aerobic-type carbon monoxide dehydrogenase small subunit (CoxS/CutS family)
MIEITVNGTLRQVESAPDTPLLWVLRDELDLRGTRFGSGAGLCGCCTVHMDGWAIRSCSIAVGDVGHQSLTTIEHLSANGLHPMVAMPAFALGLSNDELAALANFTIEHFGRRPRSVSAKDVEHARAN